MKVAVKVSIFIIAILLVILIQMALTSRNARATESEKALTASVEQALSQLIAENYKIESLEELLAEFHARLLLQINSDSDIQVDVLSADLEKGILDIKITEKYKTVKGNAKEYVYRKTVFLEEFTNTHEKAYRTIHFMAGDSIHSQYSLHDGSHLIDPGIPEMEGKSFKHWKQESGAEAVDLKNMVVSGDMTFEAVFN